MLEQPIKMSPEAVIAATLSIEVATLLPVTRLVYCKPVGKAVWFSATLLLSMGAVRKVSTCPQRWFSVSLGTACREPSEAWNKVLRPRSALVDATVLSWHTALRGDARFLVLESRAADCALQRSVTWERCLPDHRRGSKRTSLRAVQPPKQSSRAHLQSEAPRQTSTCF